MHFLLDLDENAQTNRADGIYLGLFLFSALSFFMPCNPLQA